MLGWKFATGRFLGLGIWAREHAETWVDMLISWDNDWTVLYLEWWIGKYERNSLAFSAWLYAVEKYVEFGLVLGPMIWKGCALKRPQESYPNEDIR